MKCAPDDLQIYFTPPSPRSPPRPPVPKDFILLISFNLESTKVATSQEPRFFAFLALYHRDVYHDFRASICSRSQPMTGELPGHDLSLIKLASPVIRIYLNRRIWLQKWLGLEREQWVMQRTIHGNYGVSLDDVRFELCNDISDRCDLNQLNFICNWIITPSVRGDYS